MAKDDRDERCLPHRMTGAGRPTPRDLAAVFAEVRTDRLALRRLRTGDGPALFAVRGDSATNQHNSAGPDPDLATSEQVLRRWLQDWEDNGYGYWAVVRPPAEEIIGFGGVMRQVWRERAVLNLYYRFTPSAWGNGYAAELAQRAVALARAHLPSWPVIVRTGPANIASIKTAERAGLCRRPDLDAQDGDIVFALGWEVADHAARPAPDDGPAGRP